MSSIVCSPEVLDNTRAKGAPSATQSSDWGVEVEKLISLSFCAQNDINNKLGLICVKLKDKLSFDNL